MWLHLLLYWITLDCTGVPCKVASDALNKCI